MKYVLITLFGGIIDQVTFYDHAYVAVRNLAKYVKDMNPEKNDAAVYGPNGLVANAKIFLDQNDRWIGNDFENKTTYIIANTCHSLGFLVISPGEPIGYDNPAKALSDLERMRKEKGLHIKLYRVDSVRAPLIRKKDLEKHNVAQGVDDFEYSLVSEYIK